MDLVALKNSMENNDYTIEFTNSMRLYIHQVIVSCKNKDVKVKACNVMVNTCTDDQRLLSGHIYIPKCRCSKDICSKKYLFYFYLPFVAGFFGACDLVVGLHRVEISIIQDKG